MYARLLPWCLFFWSIAGLQVTPGSTCAGACLDNPQGNTNDPSASNTNTSDIVCQNSDYASSATGVKFKNCITCLQNSSAVNGVENDVSWYLYNLRYSFNTCMFAATSGPKTVDSPCNIDSSCGPLKTAIQTGLSTPDNFTEYGYCSASGGLFNSSQIDSCVQCLQTSTEQTYMANIITALRVGCQQQPKPGNLLGLSGSIFSSSAIIITDPPTNVTLPATSTTLMTTGSIVGIAVGGSLLFLGGLVLFIVYHRRQKRLYNFNAEYDRKNGTMSITPPPDSDFRPSTEYGADQKEISTMTEYELRSHKGYTNNADYYNQLEKEMQLRQQRPANTYATNPFTPGAGISGALPTHPAYSSLTAGRSSTSRTPSPIPPSHIRNKSQGDSYALQNYLRTSRELPLGLSFPPPPPGGPPSVSSRGPSPLPSSNRNSYQSNPALASNPPFPPPPPRKPPVPSLSLPSVPRIRVPKQYVPPTIQIQEASPLDEEGAVPMQISGPLSSHDPRFRDAFGGQEGRGRSPSPGKTPSVASTNTSIREQVAADRRAYLNNSEEVPLGTGKSSMFG